MPYSTSDFDYDFPRRLIAQRPLPDRGASRLLVLDRATGAVRDQRFTDFTTWVKPGDVVVLNSSRVIPARLVGIRENGREAEVLLIHPDRDATWLAMVHPGGKLKTGRTIRFGDAAVLTVVDVLRGGVRRLARAGPAGWADLISRYGTVPLPPYIERPADAADTERYQTVFASTDGSVAAPTAGLHFTPDTLDRLRDGGAHVVEVVLHVGPGTFKPVQTEDITRHEMHREWYSLPPGTAQTINRCREDGGRVWAVGTTVTRVLESAGRTGSVTPGEGWTDLFIRPPFDFRIVGGLLTNFHLPRSTLLMLVCAFGGYEPVLAAYRHAVAAEYRLFSYGDAMLVT